MDDLALLTALHQDGARQGPGGEAETLRALELAGLAGRRGLRIADFGCGTGASTLTLARALDADIVGLDVIAPFLDRLGAAAAREGLDGRVRRVCARMEAAPFAEAAFDAIWSEGAIYTMGFEAGVRAWRRFLKPGGVLAVSEITWLTDTRPAELEAHWRGEYSEIATASQKIAVLERAGYAPLGYFPLPERAWTAGYYDPLEARFEAFLDAAGRTEAARALVEAERREIALYRRYSAYVGYGVYVARLVG